MPLQVEIWVNHIQDGLFADNTFAARSVDHSVWVNNKTVHVPNAGAPSKVEKNRTQFPATVTERKDVDLKYEIDEFTVDPVRIPHADTVELSYNKRESVIGQNRLKLNEEVHGDMIYNWIPPGVPVIDTLGAAGDSWLPGTTGGRKKTTRKSFVELNKRLNADNVPMEGRCVLLDAYMYNDLLDDMTDAQQNNFLAGADPIRGVIGHYMGFDFYQRSKVAQVTADGTPKPWGATGDVDDCAAALVWHDKYVSRALGAAVMFDDEGNPLYYGDILSFLQRAGGRYIRSDKAGIYLLKQGA